jgi:hypothetical protein
VFSVDQIADADNKDDGAVTLNFVSKLQKESSARVLQLGFDRKGRSLLVLNADSTLEIFKVNIDKPDAILKKLVRNAKKDQGILGKRAHAQMEQEGSK